MAGPVLAGEVYEGMYSMDQKFTETADVGVSMNTAQTKINKARESKPIRHRRITMRTSIDLSSIFDAYSIPLVTI
jgi:hypothetical protein